MNESQLLSNIKSELIAQVWTGSSNVVFPTGSVSVVGSISEVIQQALNTMRTPWCLIEPGVAESDPEHDEEPDLVRFQPICAIGCAVSGDQMGENVILGANKTGGSTVSEGRGIVEVEQEFYNAVGKLNALEGITIQIRQRGIQGAVPKAPGIWIAYRMYQLEAWGTMV